MSASLLVRPDSLRAKFAGLAPALCLLLPLTVHAFRFSKGEVKGSFDTTISVGLLDRLQNPNPAYYGTSSVFDGVHGLHDSVNADDGNLNFPKGIASELAKVNHDFELEYRDSGFLASGYYFYDAKVVDHWDGRTPLSDAAIGVGIWLFSDLKFQADMGILLMFMFLMNMLGAILLLPALARWLYRHHTRSAHNSPLRH